MNSRILVQIATICLLTICASSHVFAAKARMGFWAAEAWTPAHNRDYGARSPNGRFTVAGGPNGPVFLMNGHAPYELKVLATAPLWEVVWKPDSSAFAINASDGGAVGTWETFVFNIDRDGKTTQVPLAAIILEANSGFTQCTPAEEPNIAVVGWHRESLFIMAEVPPHSSCMNMGSLRGYEITNEGKIISELSGLEVRKQWRKKLGCRFRSRCEN